MQNANSSTTRIVSTMPFQVRTGCGHIVIRRMREATAGVRWSESVVIDAPNGRVCPDCERDWPEFDSGAWNHPMRLAQEVK